MAVKAAIRLRSPAADRQSRVGQTVRSSNDCVSQWHAPILQSGGHGGPSPPFASRSRQVCLEMVNTPRREKKFMRPFRVCVAGVRLTGTVRRLASRRNHFSDSLTNGKDAR